MQRDELAAAAQPQAMLNRLAEQAASFAAADAGTIPDHSVREDDYKGHHIVVRTRYEIEVDGTPVHGHLGVTNDGHVHYHPVPNVSFPSAIELVRTLIDAFPDDFSSDDPTRGEAPSGHGQDGH